MKAVNTELSEGLQGVFKGEGLFPNFLEKTIRVNAKHGLLKKRTQLLWQAASSNS